MNIYRWEEPIGIIIILLYTKLKKLSIFEVTANSLGAMGRQKVTCPHIYVSGGAKAHCKLAIPLDSAPTKQILPQRRFKIYNNPQAKMSGKTNRLVNQEGR